MDFVEIGVHRHQYVNKPTIDLSSLIDIRPTFKCRDEILIKNSILQRTTVCGTFQLPDLQCNKKVLIQFPI